ncbi:beta-glucoside-specific PTS transporter subunit IIABC [Brochothrix thermosphacta]|uniref:PTS beta-glucoside transporter subunit EIIBCA n=4 Tax=Brochothrix thermosphacta TaxID=2756 RepID=A0A1D2L529_BROTH|nr:beta-glucoside-specific PTS transporter subunit IIABC [Brochothrix thermosphacta]ATF25838.1 PTS beta-glucoside transporter subunit EIIBCA [Brochothrix thermosphacta]ATH85174.1 PTS beta-glucoside transporter subunit EIIBCA [Brochothrix thermosphacta]MPQ28548.1 PTS beta-glucoside transporter subunit EIIBCA [Brochothrix thermosphacta]ODJ56546.1 PTS beta-glucoside transporter subunit EIIBCA [Brochothrix thermosphacta]ODJ57984.1 PTS beta-glucoside transporter subunit EIIBCA [Brochothrix thermosp
MKYTNTAKEILKTVGGEDNIESLVHCMTRLRFVLKDESQADDAYMKNIPGVMGVMKKGGQYQVIMGNDVASYFKELQKISTFSTNANTTSSKKKNPFEAFVDIISSCMSPLIPALLGGGMIKVLLILLPLMGLLDAKGQTYTILAFFGDAPFYFLPIMLAYTAAIKFNVTPMLAVSVAGIMLHPNFAAMVTAGDPVFLFGIPVTLASYSSSVIPILIMVWLMQYIESFFEKIIPTAIKSFMKPLLIILISGFLALVVVGPLGTYAGELLSTIILGIQDKAGWLALGLMAAFMPLIIMTGMHWAFAPIFLIASPATPDILILPAMLASNIAQGAATLAVSLKAKNKNLKQISAAASISALVAGVTEPALYGVNLKLKKPLYAAMISGGIVGIYIGITGLKSFAFAVPSVVSLPQFIGGGSNINIFNALVVTVGSFLLTFILTWIFGFDEEPENAPVPNSEAENTVQSGSGDTKKIAAPTSGKVVPLEKVADTVFSEKMMGDGIAILPDDNTFVAPFNGTVTTVFPTKHAIGLTSDSGIELLIHIGLETVSLDGKFFTTFVEAGDTITEGQKLVEVALDQLIAAGYDITTPVIVTNTDAYIDIISKDVTTIKKSETILYVV